MRLSLLASMCALLASPLALASEPITAEASVTREPTPAANSSGPRRTRTKFDRRLDTPWLTRWRPEARLFELGVYGGLFMFSKEHELYEPNVELPSQGWQSLRRFNPAVGGRVGYYPFRFVGLELEGGVIPTQSSAGDGALPFALRGHFVGQLGLWSVTPFVLIGGGMLGVNSKGPLGTDIDPALTIGGGVKIYVNRWIALRVDVRDLVSHRHGVERTFEAHNLEALFGLSVVLNRRNTPPRAIPAPEPEPEPIPEPVSAEPIADTDNDGFPDDVDACPEEPGIEPDGCPIRDTDGDGHFDDVDSCIEVPETVNGFVDEDGCPDELPDAIQKFTGSIAGITFDTNKATIRRASLPILDEAVRVLLEYPDLRFEISGHTDDEGTREHNLELSQQRADSVASYLVGMGVDESRIVTVGAGPDRPIAENTSKAGRASNRRIEFRLLTN